MNNIIFFTKRVTAISWVFAILAGLYGVAFSQTVSAADSATTTTGVAPVDELVDGLRNRLEQNPDDVDGWVLLAKSYHFLQRYDEAADAYQRARDYGYQGEIPQLDEGQGTSQSLTLRSPSTSPVFERIAQLASIANANKSSDQVTASPSIKINLSVAPALMQSFPADTTVFLFAKAVSEGQPAAGPPSAVQRLQLSELPASFVLDDEDAMLPSLKVSGLDQAFVIARISPSGQPTRQDDDIEFISEIVTPAAAPTLSIVLDQN